MTELAKAYMAKHPSESITVLQESMSNTGGIEGTKIGRVNIGLVTDEPKGPIGKSSCTKPWVGRRRAWRCTDRFLSTV